MGLFSSCCKKKAGSNNGDLEAGWWIQSKSDAVKYGGPMQQTGADGAHGFKSTGNVVADNFFYIKENGLLNAPVYFESV